MSKTKLEGLTFVPFTLSEKPKLIDWLTSDRWDFYENTTPSRDKISSAIDKGEYHGDECRTFWMRDPLTSENVGLIRIYDLLDESAMFDLRVKTANRGTGIGKHAVRWLTAHVFNTYPKIIRIEGQTREDNIAMRKVFRSCGYLKEAHYRACWKNESNEYLDSIGYGILKSDFENGTVTPVRWDDEASIG
ncbi:GNAT family protein [Virgibacillus sp. 179-BFC.A HS]|uniref:GNAT family protein n=1 Tax=Tigheibacillus jepli TaxID=3035914 RepID=A0ABU5CEA4_9BACI|nr:GNAT family protein [Virgibacillus sp. 179-BFC.A HS]MDY0404336.1 GNAT family protein [Virgibacillus sp. 179-BFC.A HS]